MVSTEYEKLVRIYVNPENGKIISNLPPAIRRMLLVSLKYAKLPPYEKPKNIISFKPRSLESEAHNNTSANGTP